MSGRTSLQSIPALLAGRIVVRSPTQDARLYVNVSWLRGDQFFTGEFKIFVRYETLMNKWAAYQQVSTSPEQSFCVQFNSAIWRRSYGWG